MKYISQSSFISLFKTGDEPVSFREFIRVAQVKSGAKIVPLSQYMKSRNIEREDIRMVYDHIVHRNDYLTRFYATSMTVGETHIIEPPMTKTHLDNNQCVHYKNVIRNLHYKNILQNTKSGLVGLPSFLNVLKDLYLHFIIDYKILTPSALHYIREGRIGSVFSSFYFRASIMNPYLVYSLNHVVLKGQRIFTPTLGWTSYAYGFSECPYVREYVGVDVIPEVCKKTAEFMREYPRIRTEIFCAPSEGLLANPAFKYENYFDTVFFSPPYYELELYPGKNQSTTVYKTYEEWLEGYWHGTVRLCHRVLKRGGKMCYILSSGGGNHEADILKDMNDITKQWFKWNATMPMWNKNVHSTKHRETAEKIMVFSK